MKRRKAKNAKPQIRLVGWEAPVRAAVAVAGLASGVALAAPGDLDPTFGDVGRHAVEMPAYASLWSVDVRDDDSVLFGGGGEYDYYASYIEDFVGGLLADGTPDPGFAAASLQDSAVYDTAVQSDGKLVGVGAVRLADGRKKLLLFRLLPGGALDPAFGLSGLVVINDGTTGREAGYAVTIDAGGGIVVAGERGGRLMVARTNTNGALDAGFGTGGIYLGPAAQPWTLRIASVPGGGYRLIGSIVNGSSYQCSVVGITAAGVADAAFGNAGFAAPPVVGGASSCTSLVVQGDGRALVGGHDIAGRGYVGRLLTNGAVDPSFTPSAGSARFRGVSALAVGATGKIFVVGPDPAGKAGAKVIRLLPDGTLDALYGSAGEALVDPKVRYGSSFWINDAQVGSNDSLVIGGNVYPWWTRTSAFVARLKGDTAGGGPGVFSFTSQRLQVTEQGGTAVLTVRRTGGTTGAVAVSYTTGTFPYTTPNGGTYSPGVAATTADFTASTGRLTWADGDSSERQIVVPINADSGYEKPEWFEVVLESPEGGAGLGLHGAEVEIAGASYPFGDFTIYPATSEVREGETAQFYVSRDYYAQGAASVTVRVAAGGTATAGEDFRNSGSNWQDVVVRWADGEMGGKQVSVPIVADGNAESVETFTLELTSPAGGGLVGEPSRASMQITGQAAPVVVNPPPEPSNKKRGGGSFGWLGAMLLGLAGAMRRLRRPHGGALKA